MGSRVILLVRLASKIDFFPQKRFRTRWISRTPVKILSEDVPDEHNEIENKLRFETQILKTGSQPQTREEPPDSNLTDRNRSKLSAVVAEHLHKAKEHRTSQNKGSLGQSTKKGQHLRRADPFGLTTLGLDAETSPEELPDPDFGTHAEGSSTVSYNSSATFSKESTRAPPVQTPSTNKNPTRSETEQNGVKIRAPKSIQRKEGDDKLRKVMLLTKSKKMREKHDLVAVEGKRLVKDFIDAGATPKMIFFSRQQDIENICAVQNQIELHKVKYKQLCLWTEVATSQGVLGIFEISKILRQTPPEDALPITVICDNVRDPGNMGSVLRIAAAAGCQNVIVTKGCVDLWDSKVLRSAAGAHSRVQLINDLSWEAVPEHLPDGCVTFAADSSHLQSHPKPLLHYNKADFLLASHVALIVGGETHGLGSSALALASARLHIPLSLGVDSLNTAIAFAVIVFEARRHLTAGT